MIDYSISTNFTGVLPHTKLIVDLIMRYLNFICLDETLFVTIKSSLSSNGVFWCRVWNKNENFDDDIIDIISKELGYVV